MKNGRRRFHAGHILQLQSKSRGYFTVKLSGNGNKATKTVHSLVIRAFKGLPPFPKAECLHGPAGSLNNRIENLSWGTSSQNRFDRRRDGTDHEVNKTHCPQGHPLQNPNLDRSVFAKENHRECLACKRASANLWRAKQRGETIDFKANADENYANILVGTKRKIIPHNSLKTQCPRGHLLQTPNLDRHSLPRRACLACRKASATHLYHAKKGNKYDIATNADALYKMIMSNIS
jgi:hypothetical protein